MTYPKKSGSLPGSSYLAYGEDKGAIIYYESHPNRETGGEDPLKNLKYYHQSIENNRKECIKGVHKKRVIKSRLFQKPRRFNKSQSFKHKNHSERRIIRESRPHNGSRGGNPGEIPRLLVGPPGQAPRLKLHCPQCNLSRSYGDK